MSINNLQCSFIKKNGNQCKLKCKDEIEHCHYHKNYGKCGICLDNINFRKLKKLDCDHYFHKSCIDRWYLNKPTCPLCRKECPNLLPVKKEFFRVLEKRPYYGPYYFAPNIELLYNEIDLLPQDYNEVYDGEIVVSENENGIVIKPFMH